MNQTTKSIILTTFLLFSIIFLATASNAATLASKLRGRILIQVEEKGEAWYVNPTNDKRYYLGRPADAFNVMRTLGLGISEQTYTNFAAAGAKSLAGQIVLRVQAKGEAYYIHPTTYKLHYLGRPADAFEVMRKFGLGISNANLALIAISGQTPTASNATEPIAPVTITTPTPVSTPTTIKKVWELVSGFTTPTWSAPAYHCGNGVCEEKLTVDGMFEFEDAFWCPLDCPTTGYSTYQQGRFYTFAQPQYEYVAKAILNDMQYCHTLIKNYLGISFDHDRMFYLIQSNENKIQTAHSGNDSNGFAYQNPETFLTQENTDIAQGVADNFWVKSSPTYCANAHEMVHMFPSFDLDRWWKEGTAEYFTRLNHNDFGGNECLTNGFYGPSYATGEKQTFAYSNLSTFCFNNADMQANDTCYETSVCAVKYLNDTYGNDVLKKIMTTFENYDKINPASPGQLHSNTEFIDHGIVPVTGESVRSALLSRFGLK